MREAHSSSADGFVKEFDSMAGVAHSRVGYDDGRDTLIPSTQPNYDPVRFDSLIQRASRQHRSYGVQSQRIEDWDGYGRSSESDGKQDRLRL